MPRSGVEKEADTGDVKKEAPPPPEQPRSNPTPEVLGSSHEEISPSGRALGEEEQQLTPGESRLFTEATATWPLDDYDQEQFMLQVISDIRDTGYSLISMPELGEAERGSLAQEMREKDRRAEWGLPSADFEAAFLGTNNETKMFIMPEDVGPLVSTDVLPEKDSMLSRLTVLLAPHTPSCFGFQSFCRVNAHLRTPISMTEEMTAFRKKMSKQKLGKDDEHLYSHLSFLERRKLSLFYLVDGAASGGGEVSLFGNGAQEINITMKPNQLLLFRHDLMSYEYKPGTKDIVMQSWILTEPWSESPSDANGLVQLPDHMLDENRVSVLAAHTYTAAGVLNAEQFWCGLFCAADGQVAIPSSRWDHSLYYSPETGQGLSYARHGALLQDEVLTSFDNAFFRIDEAEVFETSPAQRLILEVGYETLNMVGFTRESLRDQRIATMVGDSQSDWVNLFAKRIPSNASYAGSINAVTASRLAFVFGLRGPSQHIDTACSSSLVALDRGHKAITAPGTEEVGHRNARPPIGSTCKQALISGISLVLDPHLYLGYCGATMLSRQGRCFTFNESAEGFARGEGASCLFLHSSTQEEGHPEMLVALVGSFTNQDGKSASMTAPNGPSQKAATVASLKMSRFTSADVSACECHGTGTALGDPIEVSALKGAFAFKDTDHPAPLPHSSAKTNMGHNEANAGLLGLTKCIMMLTACTNSPNNHLTQLNHNLDVTGFPVFFGCAAFPFGTNTGLMGVSSFGSGGTNARADVWGRCMRGAAKTVAFFDGSELLRKKGLFLDRIETFGAPGPVPKDSFSLVGTWDGWKEKKRMERKVDGDGEWEATITIGETLSEQFHIILNHDLRHVFHPAVPMASAAAEIVGPIYSHEDKHWVINASKDQVHVGATYRIKFHWKFDFERGETKSISWEPAGTDPEMKALEFIHQYSVVGSWTSWKMSSMTLSTDGVYTTTIRIGQSGEEEYQIVRDRDWNQVIYPAVAHCMNTTVPVRGPDVHGSGKNWLLRGQPGSELQIKLSIRAGTIEVQHHTDKNGVQKWKSTDEDNWHEYYISGSWNQWKFTAMHSYENNVYRHRVVASTAPEQFAVAIDQDWEQTLYFDGDGHLAFGPYAGDEHCLWPLEGHERPTAYDIVLHVKPEGCSIDYEPVAIAN